MERTHNYRFENLVELCREHYQEIADRKPIAYLLQDKQVRYITPEGRFGYAKFGDFYFTRRNTMMLVTKELPIARYHKPDSMSDSLWSTVPVLFAGIETGMRDCHGQMIYSGDVLDVLEPYQAEGTVVWFSSSDIPLVRLDNHCVYFNQIERSEIIGNVFYDITLSDWECNGSGAFFGRDPFYLWGATEDEINQIKDKIKNAPSFKGDKPMTRKRHSMIYNKTFSEVGIREYDKIIAFCAEGDFDSDDELLSPELYIDSCHDGDGEGCLLECIPIDLFNPDYDKVKTRVDELILQAHNDPETRYFLANMKEYVWNESQYNKLASLFEDASEYHIFNIIMPFDVAFHL